MYRYLPFQNLSQSLCLKIIVVSIFPLLIITNSSSQNFSYIAYSQSSDLGYLFAYHYLIHSSSKIKRWVRECSSVEVKRFYGVWSWNLRLTRVYLLNLLLSSIWIEMFEISKSKRKEKSKWKLFSDHFAKLGFSYLTVKNNYFSQNDL
jgi:hypothetical protein